MRARIHLQEDRKIALKKLDDAMDKCWPEYDAMFDNVKKIKTEFLSLWKNYENHKISEKEFLQITNKFAQTLDSENQMNNRFTKILEPLETKLQKIREILNNSEDKHD